MSRTGLFQRILALVLCAVMVVGFIPSTVFTARADELSLGEVTGDDEVVAVPEDEPSAPDGETGENNVPLGLHYAVEEGSVVIMGYEGTVPTLVIPAEIEGFPVTRIENGAFAQRDALTSVVLPDSITQIGKWVFEGCDSLTSVTMPEGPCVLEGNPFCDCPKMNLTSYEGGIYAGSRTNPYAFLLEVTNKDLAQVAIHANTQNIAGNAIWGFGNITELTIPDSVLTIAENAIYGCVNVTCLTIGSGVEYIGANNFFGMDALEAISISEDNAYYCMDAQGVLFNKDKTELVMALPSLTGVY